MLLTGHAAIGAVFMTTEELKRNECFYESNGEAIYKPDMQEGNPIRLYTQEEIEAVLAKLKMNIFGCYTAQKRRQTEKFPPRVKYLINS